MVVFVRVHTSANTPRPTGAGKTGARKINERGRFLSITNAWVQLYSLSVIQIMMDLHCCNLALSYKKTEKIKVCDLKVNKLKPGYLKSSQRKKKSATSLSLVIWYQAWSDLDNLNSSKTFPWKGTHWFFPHPADRPVVALMRSERTECCIFLSSLTGGKTRPLLTLEVSALSGENMTALRRYGRTADFSYTSNCFPQLLYLVIKICSPLECHKTKSKVNVISRCYCNSFMQSLFCAETHWKDNIMSSTS